MPGIEARAPERTETSNAALRWRRTWPPMIFSTAPSACLDLLLQIGGIGLAVLVVVGADLGRDGEARPAPECRGCSSRRGWRPCRPAGSCPWRRPRPCRRRTCRPISSWLASYPSICEKSATPPSADRICDNSLSRLIRRCGIRTVDLNVLEERIHRRAQRRRGWSSPRRTARPRAPAAIPARAAASASMQFDFLAFRQKRFVRLSLVAPIVLVFFDADDVARPAVGDQQVSTVVRVEKGS